MGRMAGGGGVTDLVVLVLGQRPDTVDQMVSQVLVHERALQRRLVEAGHLVFDDPAGRTAAIHAQLRLDRTGTVVELSGLPDAELEARLASHLGGVAPGPAMGARVGIAEPEPPPAPVVEVDDVTSRTVPAASRRRPVLRFADGSEMDLTGSVLLGRHPAPRTADDRATLVPVDDPERAISKTHLAVELQAGQVWVEDLGSTNGTSVIGADGQARWLQPKTPTAVDLPATLRLGNVVVTVDRR
jgi:hypothetical protein